MSGFSARNLWRMMQFYETYRDKPKLSALLTDLSWTHNLLILGKCKRDDEREFYLRLAHGQKWPSRELERQINGALFERTVLSPPKLSAPLTELHPDAAALFKDTYLVEFLDLPPTHSEADLHHGLVEHLKRGYWRRFFFQRKKNRRQKTARKLMLRETTHVLPRRATCGHSGRASSTPGPPRTQRRLSRERGPPGGNTSRTAPGMRYRIPAGPGNPPG